MTAAATAIAAIIFIPRGPHPLNSYFVLACTGHIIRRGYRLFDVLSDWDAVATHLASGAAHVVILATRTHRAGEADRVEVVDEEQTRVLYRRNDAIGRHRVPAQLTENGVRRILDGAGPAPVGMDPESIAAARRIARHFETHGCV